MNYREKIRKAIECPQLNNTRYGEWGALTLEQRKYIKRLLDELDSADNYLKKVYLENKQLEDKLSKIETLIINHNRNIGDIYYKYNSKFLKSELKQRILEIVYEVSEWI